MSTDVVLYFFFLYHDEWNLLGLGKRSNFVQLSAGETVYPAGTRPFFVCVCFSFSTYAAAFQFDNLYLSQVDAEKQHRAAVQQEVQLQREKQELEARARGLINSK